MELTRQQREEVLQKVSRILEKHYFNPAVDIEEWQKTVKDRKSRILAASNHVEFEKEMHALVSQLGTSHTSFFNRNFRPLPSRQVICTTFQECKIEEESFWMVQDVQEDGPGHRAGLETGDLILKINGDAVRPPEPPLFEVGTTMAMIFQKRDGSQKRIVLKVPGFRSHRQPFAMPRALLFSKIGDSIGYLKINIFPGVVGIDLAKQIDEAIASFQTCKGLIVDLRGNSGGGIGGLRLISYLTPDKLPVGYSLTGKRAARGYKKEKLKRFGKIPSSKWLLPWLALRYGIGDKSIVVVTEGLGPQPFHGRIAILVNQHSASASEIVAAFAQENELAKIVGTKTPGRLVPSRRFKLPYGYFLSLPVGTYLTWQGKQIEGEGVSPDYPVHLSYEALLDGKDNQLEKAIEIVE